MHDSEDDDFREEAELAMDVLNQSIDTVRLAVKAEHELIAKLMVWDQIILHIDTYISEGSGLAALTMEIHDELLALRTYLESDTNRSITFIGEDERILMQLKSDVDHRAWQAVRKDSAQTKNDEIKLIRLEKSKLKGLRDRFARVAKAIRRREKELQANPQVREYIMIIYSFSLTYEKIFRDLWHKERSLLPGIYRLKD